MKRLYSSFSSSFSTLVILSLIYFIENYDRSLISVSPIPYIDYNSYQYSLLSGTLFAIVYTLSGLFFSITNQLNYYRVYSIAIACLIFSFAIFFVAFVKTFWQQALLRIIMGLAQSVVTPFSSGIISSHFDEKYRGIAFSVFNFGAYLSFSLALSLGTFIYDMYGWKTGYYLFGFLGIALAIITPFLVEDKTDFEPRESLRSLSATLSVGDTTVNVPPKQDFSYYPNNHSASCISSIQSMFHIFGRVLSLWKKNPSLYLLCLATGVRIGAGYVWTSYTSVYYSELYVTSSDESGDTGDKCIYSYNRSYVPLTNQLDHVYDLNQSGQYFSSGSTCDRDYPYCFISSGECRDINSLPWQNKGISHSKLQSFMSWVPLVGSGLGSMVGGHLSDILSRNAKKGWTFGRAGRPIVAGTSALVSTPFVLLALYAGYPGCFLYFIPSGFTGEMYLGASLALLADITPVDLIVPSVALFMFIVTLIGGNAPLLVPLVLSSRPITHHTFTFQAAPPIGSSSPSASIPFEVLRRSGVDLQMALIILFTILYLTSSFIYYLCAYSLWLDRANAPVSASYQTLDEGCEEEEIPAAANKEDEVIVLKL